MIQTDRQTSDRQSFFVLHCYRGLPSDGLISKIVKIVVVAGPTMCVVTTTRALCIRYRPGIRFNHNYHETFPRKDSSLFRKN